MGTAAPQEGALCGVAVLRGAGTVCMEAWLPHFFRKPAQLFQDYFVSSSGVLGAGAGAAMPGAVLLFSLEVWKSSVVFLAACSCLAACTSKTLPATSVESFSSVSVTLLQERKEEKG